MSEEKSLMVIAAEVIEIERKLIESGGEITDELAAVFELSAGNLKDKVDRYWHVMNSLEGRAEYFRAIEHQAKNARAICENTRERLKTTMKFAMQSMQISEAQGNDFRFVLSQGKDKLNVDMQKLPPEYHMVPVPPPTFNREKIEADLAFGLDIPGVTKEPVFTLRPYVNSTNKLSTKGNKK